MLTVDQGVMVAAVFCVVILVGSTVSFVVLYLKEIKKVKRLEKDLEMARITAETAINND